MIIVSQDKKTILNFDNIQDIRIERYTTHQKGKYIYKIFGGNFEGYATEIGNYETEERAKEILEEIIKCYANTEQYKCLSGMPNCAYEEKVNVLNKLAENAVIYEMPQE